MAPAGGDAAGGGAAPVPGPQQRRLRLFDPATGDQAPTLRPQPFSHDGSLALSPAGRLYVVGQTEEDKAVLFAFGPP